MANNGKSTLFWIAIFFFFLSMYRYRQGRTYTFISGCPLPPNVWFFQYVEFPELDNNSGGVCDWMGLLSLLHMYVPKSSKV